MRRAVDGAMKNSGAPEYIAIDTALIFESEGNWFLIALYFSNSAIYILRLSMFIPAIDSGSFSIRDIMSRARSGSTQNREAGVFMVFLITLSQVE